MVNMHILLTDMNCSVRQGYGEHRKQALHNQLLTSARLIPSLKGAVSTLKILCKDRIHIPQYLPI